MRLAFILVFVISASIHCQGQSSILDSLKRAVDQYTGKQDTSYVLLRNSLTVQKIYHDPSDTTQADFIKETLRISQKLNFPKGIMLSYQRLGTVYQFFLGDPLLAIDYYQMALDVIDKNPKLRVHTPNCKANIASIYFDQKEYRKALMLYREIDAEFSANTIMAQYIANVYGAMEEYDSAIFYFRETIKKAELLNNIIVKAYAHNALAMMLTKNGQLTEAVPNIEESLRLVDAHQLELVRPAAYTNASEIYLAQKQYDKAETYANLALELANKINNLSMAVSAYATLQGIYEAKGDYKKSLEAYKQYTILNDSISNADRRVETSRLEIEYEAKKREMAINQEKEVEQQRTKQFTIISLILAVFLLVTLLFGIVFYMQRKKLARLNAELSQLNEKVSLLNKQNFHFTKNSLAEMVSLLNLQASRTTKEGMREALMAGKLRMETINLLYRQLFNSPDSMVKMEEYIPAIVNNTLEAMGKDITMGKINVEHVNLSNEKAFSLGLIINEACINACKYALIDHQIFSIQMDVADGRVKMQLSDTGPGLPEGIDWQTSPSFGLQLIRLLASHLNAELSVKNSHEGLTYHIVFNT